ERVDSRIRGQGPGRAGSGDRDPAPAQRKEGGLTMASVFKPEGAKKYTILYFDENGRRRKKAGTTDKAVSERIARDIENRVALRREGLVDSKADSYRDHEARPLPDHLAAWRESLEAKGATPKHIDLFTGRARRVVALLLGARLSEIEP